MDFKNHSAVLRLERELKLRNYSVRTISAYTGAVGRYLGFCGEKWESFGQEKVEDFILKGKGEGLSPQTLNLQIQALQFFYRNVLNWHWKKMRGLKKSQKLPVVLNREEIQKLLATIGNHKHRIMLALAYGSGLRVSELVNLRMADLDFVEKIICIREGKGGKDRITMMPEKLLVELEKFCFGKGVRAYVFESERGGKLTSRTAQKVFERALVGAEILKEASIHSLRHSFATHCLENGVDVRYVQELLGHANIRTTQRYTQVSRRNIVRIASPL